jgi:hypothetical protein
MPIRLFHRTDAIAPILTGGFRDGDDGGVWFSRVLDCFGQDGSRILEVRVEMTEESLAAFAIEVVEDEVEDENGEFVKDEEGQNEHFVWFKIPAAVVNSCSSVRQVTLSEAREMLDEDESDQD